MTPRETGASNNDYLSFLFYWQVMETGGSNAEGFVNKTYRRQPRQLGLASRDISRSPLRGRPLGEYLRDECRDAIAHIRRKPGKRKLELDRTEERYRVSTSTRVAKAFAEYYIRETLKLQHKLYLMRKGRRGFPTYVDDKYISEHSCIPAYQ